MSEGWQYVASASGIEFLYRCKAGERRRLIAALRSLADNPSIKPDASSTDLTGRPISLVRFHGFEIAYWVDHFAKEVRVIEVSFT